MTTATGVAVLLACLSGILLYVVARAVGVSAWAAWIGVLTWTLVPASVFTGAATVPELPTSALCASAILLLRRTDLRSAWLAAGLVLPATLSRYEAWPVAIVLMVANTVVGVRERTMRCVAQRIGPVALACAGPVVWILWNHHAHGNALSFHVRVSNYWFLSGGGSQGVWADLRAFVEPLMADGLVLLLVALVAVIGRWGNLRLWRDWMVPGLSCVFLVAALLVAQRGGGAPTHHPERSMLAVWAVGWIAVCDLLPWQVISSHRVFTTGRVVLLVVIATGLSTARLGRLARSYGVNRPDELVVGDWLRNRSEGSVWLAPRDYGYFAILAAMQSGDRVTLAASVEPQDRGTPSPFDREDWLRRRVCEGAFRWLVAQSDRGLMAKRVGDVRLETGAWVVVEVRESDAVHCERSDSLRR